MDDSLVDDFRNQFQMFLDDLYTAENMDFTPVASVVWLPSPTIPAKWLKCDGQNVYRSDYPELYDALPDYQFVEVPSGLDIIILPDLSDRFLYGANADGEINDVGGATTHTLTTAEMPAHTHGVPVGTASGASLLRAAPSNNVGLNTFASASQGGGGSHNNMPPYIRGYFIIKALP